MAAMTIFTLRMDQSKKSQRGNVPYMRNHSAERRLLIQSPRKFLQSQKIVKSGTTDATIALSTMEKSHSAQIELAQRNINHSALSLYFKGHRRKLLN